MSSLSLARPAADESKAAYHGYIAQVSGEQIGRYLTEQIKEMDALTSKVDDAQALHRYAPGKWSVKEVIGHLADSERIFAYRLLRIGRGDTTPLPGFDENTYVPAGRFDSRPLGSVVGEWRAVRQGTIALAQDLPADGWTVRGEASSATITPRALIYIIVGHTTHHAKVLRERYGLSAGSGAAASA